MRTRLRKAALSALSGLITGLHQRYQAFQLECQQPRPRLFQRILIFQACAWSFGAQAEMCHPVSCLFNFVLESVHQTYPFQL